jgi:hypothetical protein
MEPWTTKRLAATGISIAALLTFAPRSAPAVFAHNPSFGPATPAFVSAPPKPGRRMHWFHAHANARASRF